MLLNEINFTNPYRPSRKLASDKVTNGLKIVASEASDSSTINLILETAKDICVLFGRATNALRRVADPIAKFTFFSNTLRVFAIGKHVHTLYEKTMKELPVDPELYKMALRKKQLTIANSATGIAAGGLTIPFLLQSLGAFQLTKISEVFERLPGIGFLAKIYPISTVLSLIALLQLSLSLAQSLNKLADYERKLQKIEMKSLIWGSPSLKTLQEKGNHQKKRLGELKDRAEALKAEFKSAEEDFITAEQQYNTRERFKGVSLKGFWKTRSLKRRAQQQAGRCQKISDQYAKTVDKHNSLLSKYEDLEILTENFDQLDQTELEALSKEKLAKWRLKNKIVQLNKAKEACQIAIKTIVIISIIASLILSGAGLPLLPIILTTTALALLTHLAALSVKWSFKAIEPKYKPVEVSQRFEKQLKGWRRQRKMRSLNLCTAWNPIQD